MDMQKGLVCKLTGNIANFTETCQEFKEDPIEKKKIDSIPSLHIAEKQQTSSSNHPWFRPKKKQCHTLFVNTVINVFESCAGVPVR